MLNSDSDDAGSKLVSEDLSQGHSSSSSDTTLTALSVEDDQLESNSRHECTLCSETFATRQQHIEHVFSSAKHIIKTCEKSDQLPALLNWSERSSLNPFCYPCLRSLPLSMVEDHVETHDHQRRLAQLTAKVMRSGQTAEEAMEEMLNTIFTEVSKNEGDASDRLLNRSCDVDSRHKRSAPTMKPRTSLRLASKSVAQAPSTTKSEVQVERQTSVELTSASCSKQNSKESVQRATVKTIAKPKPLFLVKNLVS